MSASRSTEEALEDFVRLARQARRSALDADDRLALAELDEQLRDAIDGARPAPKRIAAPEAVAAEEAPRPVVPAAKVQIKRRAPTAHAVLEELTIRRTDAKKLNRVSLRDNPSGYTPSVRPAFLDAYYEDAVDRVDRVTERPSRVVDAEGALVDLPDSTRDLWLIGQGVPDEPAPDAQHPWATPPAQRPAPSEPSAPAVQAGGPGGHRPRAASSPAAPEAGERRPRAASRAPAPASSAESPRASRPSAPAAPPSPEPVSAASTSPAEPRAKRPPAVVHLLEGGARRGLIARFDAAAGLISLVDKSGEETAEVRLPDVLVIFFGRLPDVPASPREGVRVELSLVNDRRVVGFSPDYQPNGSAITIVPESDRGGVDRIWVPAWSVKSLRADD